jgi:hypothetical protein
LGVMVAVGRGQGGGGSSYLLVPVGLGMAYLAKQASGRGEAWGIHE